MKLLIIDDSPEMRAVLRDLSRESGHQVVGEAENGKDGLKLFREAHADMVLLDVCMPVMGGFATARELRRMAPDTPILFISQCTGSDYVTAALELGARGYLAKSAIASDLNRAIETIRNGCLYGLSQNGSGNGKPK